MRDIQVSPGACGILGAISISGGTFSGESILNSISAINYRGSDLGAGFAYFDQSRDMYIEAFASEYGQIHDIYGQLREHFDISNSRTIEFQDRFGEKFLWSATIQSDAHPLDVEAVTDKINTIYPVDGNSGFRVISSGMGLHVRKGVGYPSDIYDQHSDMSDTQSHLWVAHTRQPTNSPGSMPVFSHPFSSYNIAVVHNGDVSSFGANAQSLINDGMSSFIGTDSELIAKIMAVLIHKYNMTLEETLSIMCGRATAKNEFNGLALDGPFSVAAAVRIGDEDYLVAMADRSKLRPALVGISDSAVIVASERNQIKALGNDFKIQQLRGGQFMIASSKGEITFG